MSKYVLVNVLVSSVGRLLGFLFFSSSTLILLFLREESRVGPLPSKRLVVNNTSTTAGVADMVSVEGHFVSRFRVIPFVTVVVISDDDIGTL